MARGGAIVVAVASVAACGYVPTQAQDVIRQDLKTGWDAYTRQEFVEAERRFRAAFEAAELRGEPGSVQSMCLEYLASTYMQRRQAAEARPLYERAVALAEKDPKSHPLQMASLHSGLLQANYLLGKLDEAEAHGRRALALHEKHAGDPMALVSTLSGLGNIASRRRRLDEAEALDRQALEVLERAFGRDAPSSAILLLNLARVHGLRGEFAEAIAVAEQALALQEKAGGDGQGAIEYLEVLSKVLRGAGRTAEARRHEARIETIRGRQGSPGAFRVGNRVELRDGAVLRVHRDRTTTPGDVALKTTAPAVRILRVDGIVGPWLHVIPEAPRGGRVVDGGVGGWVELADVCLLDRAMEDLTAQIQHSPETARIAYFKRGIIWSDRHEYDRAIADFDRALRLDSSDAKTFDARGFAWLAKGEYDKAVADFGTAIRLNPRSAFAYNNRGLAHYYQKDYVRSLSDFDEAARLDPNCAEPFANRVLVLAQCPDARFRDGKRAVVSATRACEVSGWRNPYWLESLAAAYAETGDFEAAVGWQEKAIKLHTDPAAANSGAVKLELYRHRTPCRLEPASVGKPVAGGR